MYIYMHVMVSIYRVTFNIYIYIQEVGLGTRTCIYVNVLMQTNVILKVTKPTRVREKSMTLVQGNASRYTNGPSVN